MWPCVALYLTLSLVVFINEIVRRLVVLINEVVIPKLSMMQSCTIIMYIHHCVFPHYKHCSQFYLILCIGLCLWLVYNVDYVLVMMLNTIFLTWCQS